MRKLIILIPLGVLGFMHGQNLNLKPAKEEIKIEQPVIIPTPPQLEWSLRNLEYENKQFQFCPRDLTYKFENQNDYKPDLNEDGSFKYTKHCMKCMIGVYADHEGETVKHCTWCGNRDE